MLALEKSSGRNQIYNISDGRDYTQEYLWKLAADLLGVKRPSRHISPFVVHIVARARGLDTDEIRFITSNRIVDISKARKELGFRPRESIESNAAYLLGRFNANNSPGK
jgi:nucleoside-diphosphate-sugar epimerase